jgi:hypothetical protein
VATNTDRPPEAGLRGRRAGDILLRVLPGGPAAITPGTERRSGQAVGREQGHLGADGEATPAAEAEPGRNSRGERRRESPGDRGYEAGGEQEGRKVREVLRLECIDARPDPEEPADCKLRTERDRMQGVEEGRLGGVATARSPIYRRGPVTWACRPQRLAIESALADGSAMSSCAVRPAPGLAAARGGVRAREPASWANARSRARGFE